MNDVWVSITKWTFFGKKILQEIGTSKIKSSGMKVVQKKCLRILVIAEKKMQKLKSKYRNINVFKIRNKVIS